MISSQLLKGTLEGCLLQNISQEEIYGYEISQRLRACGFGDISDGTIYRLLMRLERNRAIAAIYRSSPAGPRRKYYTATGSGRQELDRFLAGWRELSSAVERLIKEEGYG